MTNIVQVMDGSFVDVSKIVAISKLYNTGEAFETVPIQNPSGRLDSYGRFYTQIKFDIHFQTPAVVASFYRGQPTKSLMHILLKDRAAYDSDEEAFIKKFSIFKEYQDYQDFVEFWKNYKGDNI